MTVRTRLGFIVLCLLTAKSPLFAGVSLGLSSDIISETATAGSFPLLQNGQVAGLFLDKSDYPGAAAGGKRSEGGFGAAGAYSGSSLGLTRTPGPSPA